MSDSKLYGWAAPVGAGDYGINFAVSLTIDPRKWVDHTWVTDYDNRVVPYKNIEEVTTNNANYWYCWGIFHAHGISEKLPEGFLCEADASSVQAKCLVLPNVSCQNNDAAKGTIFKYGLDGVCHQLANQVLWATCVDNVPPQTVKGARGYWLSNFLYGAYGRLHRSAWEAKKKVCAPPAAALFAYEHVDNFDDHAREALSGATAGLTADANNEVALETLGAMRLELWRELEGHKASLTEGVAVSADKLNERFVLFQLEAAEKIGKERYQLIFLVPADEPLNLVDPRMDEAG